jgi:hypothetical protein
VQWRATRGLDMYTRLSNVLNTSYYAAFDKPGSPFTAVVGFRTRT